MPSIGQLLISSLKNKCPKLLKSLETCHFAYLTVWDTYFFIFINFLLHNYFFHFRYLYWADYGITPQIERSLLDGSNRSAIVKTGIMYPRGISIDYSTGHVYWVDTVIDAIQVMIKMTEE